VRIAKIFILLIIVMMVWQMNAVGQQRIITDGLVSYWSFDKVDTEGDITKDVWGNNDGTIVGGAKTVGGKIGEALEFNGVDQYVDIGHPTDGSLDFGADGDFTIAAWINVSEIPPDQYTIISKGDRGSSPRILFKIRSEQVYITLANEPGGGPKPDFASNAAVVDGQWHYAALVVDRRNATKIYVDGVMDAEGMAAEGTDVNTESPMHIGKSHQNGNAARRFFKGLIDEVTIYNRALSDDEMEQNFAAEGLSVEPSTDKLALTWGKVKISE
jgi:hypothetical protein